MALTTEREQRFIEMRDIIDACKDRISKWEYGFLYDDNRDAEFGAGLFVKYEDEGPAMHISPKQWEILERIYNKVA